MPPPTRVFFSVGTANPADFCVLQTWVRMTPFFRPSLNNMSDRYAMHSFLRLGAVALLMGTLAVSSARAQDRGSVGTGQIGIDGVHYIGSVAPTVNNDPNAGAQEAGMNQRAVLMTGTEVYIEITVSQPGFLNIFGDHNNDSVFQTDGNPATADVAETAQHILENHAVVPGFNLIPLDLSTIAAGVNATLFRVIFSDAALPMPTEQGPDADYSAFKGEIEDYLATVIQQDVATTIFVEDGDAINISRSGSDFVATNYFTAPIGALDGGVTIDGTAFDETYSFNFSGGMPIPSGGLNLLPGAGNDELDLQGTPPGRTWVSVEHDYETGQVVMTDDLLQSFTIGFADLELLTDRLVSTSKLFTGTGAADQIFMDEGTTPADGFSGFSITGNVLSSAFIDPTSSIQVDAGLGDDVITISDLDDLSPFAGTFVINGEDGDDELVVEWADGPVPDVTFNGGTNGGGGDTITLQNTGGPAPDEINYVATTANDGTIEVETGATTSTITYTGLEPIVDLIPTASKTFTYPATDDNVTLDIGGGTLSGGDLIFTSGPVTAESVDFVTTGLLSITISGGLGDDVFEIQPSSTYDIFVDGEDEPVADVFNLDISSLTGPVTINLTETGAEDGVYEFSTLPGITVTYAEIEQVGMRFSDPNAFPGATYPGDIMYPLNTESGISIEPYFNWDIDNWPVASPISSLTLNVSLNSDMSSPFYSRPVFTGDPGIIGDFLITDVDDPFDMANGIPLQNSTKYFWNLEADLGGSITFSDTREFTTIDPLLPQLNHPRDRTIADVSSFDFAWDVGAVANDDVYWRLDVDQSTIAAFDGATPLIVGGDAENDDDTAFVDGYTKSTSFAASDLPVPLAFSSEYAWRVSSMWPVPPTGWVPQEIHDLDESDRMASISDTVSFKTSNLLVAPTPSYPIDGADVFVNDPVTSWYVGLPFNLLTFDVELFEDDGTGNPTGGVVCSGTGINGLTFDTGDAALCPPGGGLDPGVGYVWRVRSDLNGTKSPWSGWEPFTTLGVGTNVVVTPSYPVGDLEIYTTAPTFHWFTATKFGGLDYTVHYLDLTDPPVGTPATCAALKGDPNVVNMPTTDVPSIQITGLEPGHDYAWCVTSSNGITPDLESPVATFSVAGGPADAIPVAAWPVGNPTAYSLEQLLSWYLDGSALGVVDYEVQICDDPAYTVNCSTTVGLTKTQYLVTGLGFGDQKYWRVRANYTGGGQSDWTNPRSQGSFNVTGVLSTLSAELTHPVGGKLLVEPEATFSWFVNGSSNVPLTFRVQYSYTELFLQIGTVTITETTTNTFLNVTDLIPGHTYWWRVQISNDGGATFGPWSPVASFVVAAGAVAVQPQVGSPTNGVRLSTSSPTLSWILPIAPGAEQSYELTLSTSPDMSNPIVYSDIPEPFFHLDQLAPGTYFWQVRSFGNGISSAHSGVGVFSTSSISVGVENEGDGSRSADDPADKVVPDVFSLKQNYPNPFSPATTIEYGVAETSGVTIRIFDVLGREVRTLVDQTVAPGQHSVQWDGTDANGRRLPSGLYLYQMEAGSFSQTRSLVLMQ